MSSVSGSERGGSPSPIHSRHRKRPPFSADRTTRRMFAERQRERDVRGGPASGKGDGASGNLFPISGDFAAAQEALRRSPRDVTGRGPVIGQRPRNITAERMPNQTGVAVAGSAPVPASVKNTQITCTEGKLFIEVTTLGGMTETYQVDAEIPDSINDGTGMDEASWKAWLQYLAYNHPELLPRSRQTSQMFAQNNGLQVKTGNQSKLINDPEIRALCEYYHDGKSGELRSSLACYSPIINSDKPVLSFEPPVGMIRGENPHYLEALLAEITNDLTLLRVLPFAKGNSDQQTEALKLIRQAVAMYREYQEAKPPQLVPTKALIQLRDALALIALPRDSRAAADNFTDFSKRDTKQKDIQEALRLVAGLILEKSQTATVSLSLGQERADLQDLVNANANPVFETHVNRLHVNLRRFPASDAEKIKTFVFANPTLTVNGQRYRDSQAEVYELSSVVIHQGEAREKGDYITLTRQQGLDEKFHCYLRENKDNHPVQLTQEKFIEALRSYAGNISDIIYTKQEFLKNTYKRQQLAKAEKRTAEESAAAAAAAASKPSLPPASASTAPSVTATEGELDPLVWKDAEQIGTEKNRMSGAPRPTYVPLSHAVVESIADQKDYALVNFSDKNFSEQRDSIPGIGLTPTGVAELKTQLTGLRVLNRGALTSSDAVFSNKGNLVNTTNVIIHVNHDKTMDGLKKALTAALEKAKTLRLAKIAIPLAIIPGYTEGQVSDAMGQTIRRFTETHKAEKEHSIKEIKICMTSEQRTAIYKAKGAAVPKKPVPPPQPTSNPLAGLPDNDVIIRSVTVMPAISTVAAVASYLPILNRLVPAPPASGVKFSCGRCGRDPVLTNDIHRVDCRTTQRNPLVYGADKSKTNLSLHQAHFNKAIEEARAADKKKVIFVVYDERDNINRDETRERFQKFIQGMQGAENFTDIQVVIVPPAGSAEDQKVLCALKRVAWGRSEAVVDLSINSYNKKPSGDNTTWVINSDITPGAPAGADSADNIDFLRAASAAEQDNFVEKFRQWIHTAIEKKKTKLQIVLKIGPDKAKNLQNDATAGLARLKKWIDEVGKEGTSIEAIEVAVVLPSGGASASA